MRWFESSYPSSTICRRGGIGRRAGLKIQCPQGRAGSTPAAGIVYKEETLIYQRFFVFVPLNPLETTSYASSSVDLQVRY